MGGSESAVEVWTVEARAEEGGDKGAAATRWACKAGLSGRRHESQRLRTGVSQRPRVPTDECVEVSVGTLEPAAMSETMSTGGARTSLGRR